MKVNVSVTNTVPLSRTSMCVTEHRSRGSRLLSGSLRELKGLHGLIMLIIVSIITLSTHAQNISDDFKKVNQKMGKRRMNINITYKMYDSHEASVPYETQLMKVNMWDDQIRLHSNLFESIRNRSYYLYVNHPNKTILLNKINAGDLQKEIRAIEQWFNVDTILKMYLKTELKESTDGKRIYRFFNGNKELPYSYVDVEIDTRAYVLNRMVVYYSRSVDEILGRRQQEKTGSKTPRMEIAFSGYVFPPSMDATAFSVNPYISKNDQGKFVPQAAYKTYNLIDNSTAGKTTRKNKKH